MAGFKSLLPEKLFEVIENANIGTCKQILTLSPWDIRKLTNLSYDDITLIKNAAAKLVIPDSFTNGAELVAVGSVSWGCSVLDAVLRGLRRGTITELYGESGAGKTQLCLQAAAHCWREGAVYICTEDVFPAKRLEQMLRSLHGDNPREDYGRRIYVEHLTEVEELSACVRVRLPALLKAHGASIVVLDSIAAPFRAHYTNYSQRAQDLREVAVSLLECAKTFKLAVLCVNQVTSSFTNEALLPSLGLAWSNIVSTRIQISKTDCIVAAENMNLRSKAGVSASDQLQVRELEVAFSPELPHVATRFVVTSTGVHGIEGF